MAFYNTPIGSGVASSSSGLTIIPTSSHQSAGNIAQSSRSQSNDCDLLADQFASSLPQVYESEGYDRGLYFNSNSFDVPPVTSSDFVDCKPNISISAQQMGLGCYTQQNQISHQQPFPMANMQTQVRKPLTSTILSNQNIYSTANSGQCDVKPVINEGYTPPQHTTSSCQPGVSSSTNAHDVPPSSVNAYYNQFDQISANVPRPFNPNAQSQNSQQQPKRLPQRSRYLIPSADDANHNSKIKVPAQEFPIYWCHVYYYEIDERVGQVYKSDQPEITIDGLCAPSDNTRFCIGMIGNANRNNVANSTRQQIGKGCKLQRVGEDIYLECMSESPIFLQNPLYAAINKDHLATVYRFTKGHRIKCFDKKIFDELRQQAATKGYDDVFEMRSMCTIRMSFAKGWGANYRRSSIMTTPCWVEIKFLNPLQVLDQMLQMIHFPMSEIESD